MRSRRGTTSVAERGRRTGSSVAYVCPNLDPLVYYEPEFSELPWIISVLIVTRLALLCVFAVSPKVMTSLSAAELFETTVTVHGREPKLLREIQKGAQQVLQKEAEAFETRAKD